VDWALILGSDTPEPAMLDSKAPEELGSLIAAFDELSRTAKISKPLTAEAFGTVFGVVDPTGQPRYLIEFARERPSRQVG
jgi:hypothetical protein